MSIYTCSFVFTSSKSPERMWDAEESKEKLWNTKLLRGKKKACGFISPYEKKKKILEVKVFS